MRVKGEGEELEARDLDRIWGRGGCESFSFQEDNRRGEELRAGSMWELGGVPGS